MNGSIVYELDRPENGGLKKSLKVLSVLLVSFILFPFIFYRSFHMLSCTLYLSDTSIYLFNLYIFKHTPRLINFYLA